MYETMVKVQDRTIKLTNLNKEFWPEGLTKAGLIKYYSDISPYLLPYLYNRPLVMKRYPNGINGEAFYQKECPDYAPCWIKTHLIKHSDKEVNYILCNDLPTLIWLANQACIEIHAWMAKIEEIECPDFAVLDLDPAQDATLLDTLEIALLVNLTLSKFGLTSFPKTSGASGLHLFIPIKPVYSYHQVAKAMRYVAELIERIYPDKATTIRAVERRTGKVYLDYLQNGRGKTMAFPYSIRPLPGAPVSTPLCWSEIEQKNINPQMFNINTIFNRLHSYGDIYRDILTLRQSMEGLFGNM